MWVWVAQKGALWWDEAAGQCVEESACTGQRGGGGVSLPPGLALGRPFLPAEYDPSLPNTKVVPTVASAMELMSDWVVEL